MLVISTEFLWRSYGVSPKAPESWIFLGLRCRFTLGYFEHDFCRSRRLAVSFLLLALAPTPALSSNRKRKTENLTSEQFAQKSYLSISSFVKTCGGPSRIWLPLMIFSFPSLPASSSVSPGLSLPSITARMAYAEA